MASSPSDKSSASEVYEFTVTDEWLKSIVELVITLQASYRVWLVGRFVDTITTPPYTNSCSSIVAMHHFWTA